MNIAVFAGVAVLLCLAESKHTAPKVQVYAHYPGEFGKENTLICYVSNFYPPDITIELLKDDGELPDAEQTDLAFKDNWHFHLTKSVRFTPEDGRKFSCRVTHGIISKSYAWEPNM